MEDSVQQGNKAISLIETIREVLQYLSCISCHGGVYEFDDNEFGKILYLRDLCDEFLSKNKHGNGGFESTGK